MRIRLRALGRLLSAPFRLIFWLVRSIYRIISRTFRNVYDFFTKDPEDAPLTATFEKAVQHPMDFLSAVVAHLAALRWHLLRIVAVVIITTAFAFTYSAQILDWLAQPLPGGGIEELQAIDVTEPIGVVMRVSFMAGFSIGLPYIAFELLLFAARGLKRNAPVVGLFSIPLITSLFAAGVAFAYYVMLPTGLPMLLNYAGILTVLRPSSYVKFATGMMFWMGIAFQFPLATFVLANMGILKAKILKNQWRLAVVISSILAAAITPTVDPVNMAIVLVPLLVLYTLSTLMAFLGQAIKGKRKQAQE